MHFVHISRPRFCAVLITQSVSGFYKAFGQTFIQDDHFLSFVGAVSSVFNCSGRLFYGVLMDKTSYRWDSSSSSSSSSIPPFSTPVPSSSPPPPPPPPSPLHYLPPPLLLLMDRTTYRLNIFDAHNCLKKRHQVALKFVILTFSINCVFKSFY